MKIRLQDNSIRLRLRPSEVDRLVEDGVIEGSTRFGGDGDTVLKFELKSSRSAERILASFHSNRIVIDIPQGIAGTWFGTDQIGIEDSVPVGNGEALKVVIEKDFACLKPRPGDDAEDVFQNPDAGMKC